MLEVFGAAADAVGAVLATTTDWGSSGKRDGQYAVDLAADEACRENAFDSQRKRQLACDASHSCKIALHGL